MNSSMPGSGSHRGPIAWMAQNSIAAHLLMIILLGGGLWTAMTMQKEIDPHFELDIVNVLVSYPGAAPEEVEQQISRMRLELEDLATRKREIEDAQRAKFEAEKLEIAQHREEIEPAARLYP